MLVILHHINLFEEVRLLQRKKDVNLCFDIEKLSELHTLSIKIIFLGMTFPEIEKSVNLQFAY